MEIREIVLRRTISVWINSFNQPTYLKNIVGKFLSNEFKNLFILDNGSDSEPLNRYYREIADTGLPVMVLYYNANVGPWYFHNSQMYRMLGNCPHLYTDPDIDFDTLADNFLSRLIDLSDEYRIPKVGAALEVPTLEDMKPKFDYNTQMEHAYWQKPIAENVYDAPVDTTLHLFNPKYFEGPQQFFSGVRVAGPGFTARHLPWYKNDPMSDEEYAFYKSRDSGYSHC